MEVSIGAQTFGGGVRARIRVHEKAAGAAVLSSEAGVRGLQELQERIRGKY